VLTRQKAYGARRAAFDLCVATVFSTVVSTEERLIGIAAGADCVTVCRLGTFRESSI